LNIKDWRGWGDALLGLFSPLLYPLWVPALSIYCAARELFWGEDREERLTKLNGWKMYEHLGEAGPQLVLMVIYLVNNGGHTWFSVTSAVLSAGSLLYGIYSSYFPYSVWVKDKILGQNRS